MNRFTTIAVVTGAVILGNQHVGGTKFHLRRAMNDESAVLENYAFDRNLMADANQQIGAMNKISLVRNFLEVFEENAQDQRNLREESRMKGKKEKKDKEKDSKKDSKKETKKGKKSKKGGGQSG